MSNSKLIRLVTSIAWIVCLSHVYAAVGSWSAGTGLTGAVVNDIIEARDGSLYTTTAKGIYRSTDHGQNWIDISANRAVEITSIIEGDDGSIYISTRSGVYKKTSTNTTWIATSPTSFDSMHLASDTQGNLYASDYNEFYKSSDAGASWNKMDLASKLGLRELHYTAMDSSSDGSLYITTIDDALKSYVVKLNSAGIASLASGNLPRENTYANGITIDKKTNTLFILTGKKAYKSNDSGQTWTDLTQSISSPALAPEQSFDIIKSDHKGGAYITTYGKSVYHIHKATNGSIRWDNEVLGPYTYINSIAVDSTGNRYFGTGGSGIISTSDSSFNPVHLNNGLTGGRINSIVRNSKNSLFAATAYGVFRSLDNGQSWQGLLDDAIALQPVSSLVIDGRDRLYAVTQRRNIYKSDDQGLTWSSLPIIPTYGEVSIAIDSKGRLYASSDASVYVLENNDHWRKSYSTDIYVRNIGIDSEDNIYSLTDPMISRDGGANWARIDSFIPKDGSRAGFLFIGKKGQLLVWSNYRWYISSDYGDHWKPYTLDFRPGTFIVGSDGNLYAPTNEGIYTSDSGYNWSLLKGSDSLPGQATSLNIGPDGSIIAGTYGAGIYQYTPRTSAASITGLASGSNTALALNANIQVAAEDQGKPGQLFIAALLPSGSVYMLGNNGWSALDGNKLLPYSNISLGKHTVQVLSGNMDVSSLKGTVIFAGYANGVASSINAIRYQAIHTIQ
ncbi:hypothetical protein [Chitinimonas sp.]|uniref:hypothetical protein n=1 Tax=Chitinimonas sp. TaxID=1934313 RepID=UPI0035B2B8EB